MWQPVPWFVAGGLHSPEVARLLAYAATGGASGVVGVSDCAVKELDIPGGAIQVMPGAVGIPNGNPGGGYQSYLGRNPEAEQVVITPTGSAGPRTDLIVARIEDPQYPGAAQPVDPTVGPYVFTRVIEDVPVGTKRVQQIAGHENDSAVTLARITLPASTGTVLDSHITDLRNLMQPRVKHETRTVALATGDLDLQDTVGVAGEVWPGVAQWGVEIPEWATRVRVVGTWAQVRIPAGDSLGYLWVRIGAEAYAGSVVTETVGYDTPSAASWSRATFVCADEIAIPAAMRGTTQIVNLRARKIGGNAAGRITIDGYSAVVLTLDFLEEPI